MQIAAVIIGIALILVVLWDAFETVVLPRRVTRRLRLVRAFYRLTWPLWSAAVRALSSRRRQENYQPSENHLRVRSFVMVSDILGCLHMIITSLYRPLQGYFDNIMA
jgi:hypothetical protein